MSSYRAWISLALVAAGPLAIGCGGDRESESRASERQAPPPARITLKVPPEVAPGLGRIAFTTLGATSDIFVAEPGGEPRNITHDHAEQADVEFSPDGTQIAYVSYRNGSMDLMVANADGSGARALTDLPANERTPSWSPDGKEIVFGVEGPGERYAVYVVRVSDGKARKLLKKGSCFVGDPSWSPRGDRIALDVDCSGGGEIDVFTIRPDGSGLRKLTGEYGDEANPTWSRDGRRMAFAKASGPAIYSMRADGSGRRRLTGDLAFEDGRFSWSADGSKLLYVSEAGSDIYLATLRDRRSIALTHGAVITSISAAAPR